MPFLRKVLLALFLASPGVLIAPGVAQQKAPEPEAEAVESLPDHPGREETFGFCGGCHSFKVVGRQGMTRDRWSETIDWMTEKHSMPKLEGEELNIILSYLEKAYPPSQQPQGGWKNPFAK